MPLFSSFTKSSSNPSSSAFSNLAPVDLIKALHASLTLLNSPSTPAKKLEKSLDDITKQLAAIKYILFTESSNSEGGGGGGGSSSSGNSSSDIIVAQLSQELYNSGVIGMLIQNLGKIEFEAKKDVAQIFNNILRRRIGSRSPTVEYICTKPEILFMLINGYEHQEIALNCGTMLRECARYEALAKIILNSDQFYKFFEFVEVSTFDIASDAFSTFKELLTRHKLLSAEFLEQNYERVFESYGKLLNSENYVTRRQSLKLLGELLLDRHNFTIMTRYISSPDNLKLMMNMLKEKSRNIQFEAFHVFKVFVANPNKPKPILDILLRNQEKLIEFLTKFHEDRTEDEQFNDEKAYLIKQIRELKSSSGTGSSSSTSTSAQQPSQQSSSSSTSSGGHAL